MSCICEIDTKDMDKPKDLSFEKYPESEEEYLKRKNIEQLLISIHQLPLNICKSLALTEYGLVNDDIRRKVWPILVGIDSSKLEVTPSLKDLQSHPEYHQVILDVNRSLKRFPPGIPYEQRIALQDQLTVLILRVIKKYPNLKYYQGYHDVAVTFLLVVGEDVAFAVMERLSTSHFEECMQETMDATQRRLMFIYPIINFENPFLFEYLQTSSVGTLFALPWFLTWFGHSLNSYKSVVRLYDYFLASPIFFAIYVTAAIVLYRADEIISEECEMASVHCLLSKLPDDLPFENLLKNATILYSKYPLASIESEVEDLIKYEQRRRNIEDKLVIERRRKIFKNQQNGRFLLKKMFPQLFSRKSVFVTTAFSIMFGICAYYYKNQYFTAGVS